ncbi:hypothetical protein PC9H_011351 [Pleurotus ostreatus]|uniref:Uncharacterized protein n=1 Tax=Pleurotus ostreatus TaxID=5322 RepID=A0A8H6ZLM1_PLEOS|nr:uncharacterized protein PC9H_011351 [Pleurotus ostreatus]KAF7420833.1 hypothetical protein PC9H_011351 [Pleurotus ostreatus]KAJ8690271.1 hypothetical protein PTI98_011713 [Pleurotus ostreatus]
MWSKLSNALGRHRHESDASASSSQSQRSEVLDKVYEQHPNLSVFHTHEEEPQEESPEVPFPNNPSPPSSPSRHGRVGLFKRHSRVRDDDSIRAPSPLLGFPKKVRSTLNLRHNNSQQSLSRASGDAARASQDTLSRASVDLLSPSEVKPPPRTSSRSMFGSSRDISFESTDSSSSSKGPLQISTNIPRNTPSPLVVDTKLGSVRSILRGPNTPGTGQNVRFFSRDAYKVLSPENSVDSEASHPAPSTELFDRLQRARPALDEPPRSALSPKSSRPSLAEVFSPMSDSSKLELPSRDQTNLFDISQGLELPPIPSDLDINIEEPDMEPPGSHSDTGMLTSTPFKQAKPKEEFVIEAPVDDTIFHSLEKSPELPPVLHDRSQSFSFGQTVFFSMNQEQAGKVATATADNKSQGSPANSSPMMRNRSRAMSDTVFQNMMRSPPPKHPEADINDEQSSDLVVYSAPKPEPDPFSANANTYYTPQTLIPTTPPQGPPKHARKSSKEEGIIASLQTQLTLQTELCSQYETDLHARDELVDILNKKLTDLEKEDAKRRNVLRNWKKKVAELEKACRYLEEEVEGSRQASFERSIMDEASGEALRMLHRQIAGLEREKSDWERREANLQAEVVGLEEQMRARDEELARLREVGQNQRELQEGILGISQQWEQMGNTSIGTLDDTIMRKINAAADGDPEREAEAAEQLRVVQLAWEAERAELVIRTENMQVEKTALEDKLTETMDQLHTRDEEYQTLKSELEAQWQHTEKMSESLQGLQLERNELELERDTLKSRLEDLEQQLATTGSDMVQIDALKRDLADMEQRYADLEAEREEQHGEFEAEFQQVSEAKHALEAEKEELEDIIRQEQEHAEELTLVLQERDNQLEQTQEQCERLQHELHDRDDRITELTREHTHALSNVSRLEGLIRQRDNEIDEYSKRILERESEASALREQMTNMKREQTRVVDDRTRELQDVLRQESESRSRMETLIKERTEATFEASTLKGRVDALSAELEKLRRHVHELQQESADKEVKIVQLNKARAQDKEDMQGLNIALDSKQQELELIKRKMGVRGTAGSTPAQPSKTAHHRRDSSAFSTPSISRPSSRPPSVISESGLSIKERKITDTPAASAKIPALGKSIRANSTATPSIASKTSRGIEGSMGPPPNKRLSLAGTPTPSGRVSSLSRKSSIGPGPSAFPVPPTHKPLRRISSTSSEKDHSPPDTRSLLANVKLRPVKKVDPDTSRSPPQQNKENVESTPRAIPA